jgi:hypothetical protein
VNCATRKRRDAGAHLASARRDVGEQVDRLGRMDAVIHDAGVYSGHLAATRTVELR